MLGLVSAFIHDLTPLVQCQGPVTEQDLYILSCAEVTFPRLRGVGLGMSEDFPLDTVLLCFPLQLPNIGGQLGGCLHVFQFE